MGDIKGGRHFGVATIIWGLIIAGLIVASAVYGLITLRAQHDIINPQVRQNMVDDPAHSIAVKQDFHSKLSLIISADQNILDVINCTSNCEGAQLTGLKQIRNKAISDYNAQADSSDDGKHRESWMPKHIDTNNVPSKADEASTFLQREIKTLQEIYNKGA